MESYTRGADLPLLDLTTSEALGQAAARFGGRDALIVRHQQARFTWSELDGAATRVAAGLAATGLAPGDRIGIWAVNCVEWLLLQYGAARAGVVLVNVNPAYRSHELRFVLKTSRIRALFLHERDARTDYRAILEECGPPEHVVWLGDPAWDAMLAAGDPAWTPPAAAPDDVANIQYTSGTTGSPKGVLLTHRNLVNNGLMIAHALRATERDRICVPVPMYHCFGCVIGTMVSLVTGAAMILPAAQFDARGSAGGRASRARHGDLRRAHHVHRGAGTSRVRPLRSLQPAHRDHGGSALPDRGHAQGVRADALPGDHDRVRADRVFARDHHVAGGRSARNARDYHRLARCPIPR